MYRLLVWPVVVPQGDPPDIANMAHRFVNEVAMKLFRFDRNQLCGKGSGNPNAGIRHLTNVAPAVPALVDVAGADLPHVPREMMQNPYIYAHAPDAEM